MNRETKPGFQLLLEEIASRVVPGVTFGAALREVLTLGDRQELAYGMQSLTPLQRALVDGLGEGSVPLHHPDGAPAGDGACTWYLGQWSYGRIWLARERPADPECRLLGALSLPAAANDTVLAQHGELQRHWQECDAEMDAFFDALDGDGLQRALHEVHEAVDHSDPMLFYVGDDTITNFGKYNNLQERGADLPQCFHRRAKVTPREQWTRAERIYVFCVYWLRVAGCRGEEFCGRQLNPALLRDYFDERLAHYRRLAPQLASAPGPSIEDKARLLARCRSESADELLTYRFINGLTFYKEEHLLRRSSVASGMGTLPSALRAHLADACGVDVTQHESLTSLFDACMVQLARTGFGGDGKLNAVEALLKVVVQCAIEATGSDIGMSRGTRDVARMQRAFAEERYEEICGWQNTEYFCAVFPSAAMQERLAPKPDLLVKILYACAARMQFNHWHYAPGHCPPGTVPADRHFYYPPRLADVAIWSDQHHTGHVLAEVRYSIRSPAPLEMNGKVYPGMMDLRLFRQSGAPYSTEELMTALSYTEMIRVLHQSLANHLARSKEPVLISAFGKDWYRDYYGPPRAAAAVVAAVAAAPAPPSHVPAPVSAPTTELFRILRKSAAAADAAALVEARQPNPDVTMSYRALLAHAQVLRERVAAGELTPGAVVAVLSQRPLHQAVAIVAGIASDVIVNPLNPALSPQVLVAQLEHAQPQWLIVDGSVAPPEGLPPSLRTIAWSDVFADVAHQEALPIPSDVADDEKEGAQGGDDAGGLLIYTSGTTGASKGVHLSWSNVAANVRYAIGALGFEPGRVTGSLLPRFHTFTLISDLFPALLLGGTTVLADTFELGNVKWTVDAFVRHGVRSYSAVPVIFEALCALNAWADAPAMRMGIAGAAPLKENTRLSYAKAFGHPIIPCYGLSETTCFAAISPPDAIRPGAVGHAAGIEIRVVDDGGDTLGANVTGELAMRGPSVISGGYFRDEQMQFAQSFTADGWFKTGDIGRIDQDGYVFVTGRKKNMVIRGGEKVYLEDVDRALADLLGVLDCASVVLCRPNEPDLALTFIVTSGSPLPIDEVDAHVRGALSAHHVPDRIYFVDRIPRTATGKSSIPELLALAKRVRAAKGGA